jgi:hypothetical protein
MFLMIDGVRNEDFCQKYDGWHISSFGNFGLSRGAHGVDWMRLSARALIARV